MAVVTEKLVPMKFLSLMGVLILFIVVSYTKDNNIYTGIPDDADSSSSSYDLAKKSILACTGLGIILLIFELLLMFTGLTLFFNRSSAIRKSQAEIVLHVFGILFQVWFVLEHWSYVLLWPIWVFAA